MELRRREVGFTCSRKRTSALHRLRTEISSRSWRPALLMPQAEVAETTHTPQGWVHEPLRLIVRRVRIPVDEALVADVNHRRLCEQLEQSPAPRPRPAAARVAAHYTRLVRRWLLAVPGWVLHSGRRAVLRLAEGMLWAATFIAAYQRLRLLTSSA